MGWAAVGARRSSYEISPGGAQELLPILSITSPKKRILFQENQKPPDLEWDCTRLWHQRPCPRCCPPAPRATAATSGFEKEEEQQVGEEEGKWWASVRDCWRNQSHLSPTHTLTHSVPFFGVQSRRTSRSSRAGVLVLVLGACICLFF